MVALQEMDLKSLEAHFRNIGAMEKYGISITPVYVYHQHFKRVGSHFIFVEKTVVEQAIEKGEYTKELKALKSELHQRSKDILGVPHYLLIDHKNDEVREVIEYIIENNIHTKIYIYAPDNMFWFFHDMGHGYLAKWCNNFYDNVYREPEMLVNIFACIKMKQYKMFSRKKVEHEVIDKCYKYPDDCKKYFLDFLDSLDIEDDIKIL